MRYHLFAIPLALLAVPAAAQAPQPEQIRIPPELTDPAMADKLANMMQALSKAFLELPVGEVQAAAEGRAPTASERRLTVRDMGRRDDPNFERNLERQLEEARPRVRSAMQAFARALPSMTKALSEAANEIERATANMPQPGYPRR